MKPYLTILSQYLAKSSGIALGADKEYLFEMRLKPLMRELECHSLKELSEKLPLHAENASFQASFVEAMTTNESMFFRDVHPFDALRHHVFPALKEKENVELWSCACAAGQEAYSLAILAEEAGLKDYQILATDIDNTMISRAHEGIYTQFEIQRGLKTEQMLNYFTSTDAHHWQVKQRLKKNITFMQDNLLFPRYNKKYDVILCRYVLIYFDEATKLRIVNMLRDMLKSGGILLLGSAETMPANISGLTACTFDRTVFVKD